MKARVSYIQPKTAPSLIFGDLFSKAGLLDLGFPVVGGFCVLLSENKSQPIAHFIKKIRGLRLYFHSSVQAVMWLDNHHASR